MSFQTNLGSRRLPETLITLDELNGAILIFAVFPFSHPKTPVYFSCFGECCSSVLLWSSRNFPSAWGWVDCDRMLFFYWTYPLIFQVSLSQKRTALKSNEIVWIYISSKSISLLKAVEHLPLCMNIKYSQRSSNRAVFTLRKDQRRNVPSAQSCL